MNSPRTRWLPDARGWIDAALLVALSGLALAGLATLKLR